MTAFVSSHHQYHPAPLDQPTPQSPPSLYMSRDHATVKPLAMSDKSQSSHSSIGSSPPINSSFPSSRHSHSSANTILTPSSSAAGTVPPTTVHDIDDDMMDISREVCLKSGKRRGSISAEDQHDLYRNHDRGTGVKRSKSVDNMDSREEQMADAPPPAAVPTAQEFLAQVDVHPLHLSCVNSYPILYPLATMNIFPLYGLSSIAESVARTDPKTGAKKKLRKSYKGKILDLPGKNEIPKAKPPPTEAELAEGAVPQKGRSMGLLEMLDWPEDEWYAQKVAGKEISQPIPLDQLRRACTMTSGPIPGFDTSILGLEEKKSSTTTSILAAPKSIQTPSSTTPQHHPNHVPNGTSSTTPGPNISSASVSPALMMESSRPQRSSRKKRRKYDDSAFEGYGEGYEDEEGGEEYGEEGTKKKKKRKKVEN